MLALWPLSSTAATVAHAIALPLVFLAIAVHYFRGRGARAALPVALVFSGLSLVLDVAVFVVIERSFEMLASIGGTWVPALLVFFATWITGAVIAMDPKKNAKGLERAAHA
jgi:hypothetical protein